MIDKKKGEKIKSFFIGRQETISIAESVTSGLLQQSFSGIAEAGLFFQGGITAYNLGQKYKHLGVEPIHAQNCNCVSPEVAKQMATNVCDLFSSDWGIGITGYATPVPQSGNKLYCYYAISAKGEIKAAGKIDCKRVPPSKVQETYSNIVIDKLIEALDD